MQSLFGNESGASSPSSFGIDSGTPENMFSPGPAASAGGFDFDLENFQLPPLPVDTLHTAPTHSPNLLNLHAMDPFLVNPPRPPRGMHANPVPTCTHRPRCASPQQHIKKLEEYIQKLEVVVRVKDAELVALRPRFDRLLAAVEQLSSAAPQPGSAVQQVPARRKLKKSDFPLVQYWTRGDWKKSNSTVPMVPIDVDDDEANDAAGVPCWLQDASGTVISAEKLEAIREAMRNVWHKMLKEGTAPNTWGKITADVLRAFRNDLYNEFPELELCEDHWKLQYLCSVGYPGWYSHFVKKKGSTVKSEPAMTSIKNEPVSAPLVPATPAPGPVNGNKRKLSLSSNTASEHATQPTTKKSRPVAPGDAATAPTTGFAASTPGGENTSGSEGTADAASETGGTADGRAVETLITGSASNSSGVIPPASTDKAIVEAACPTAPAAGHGGDKTVQLEGQLAQGQQAPETLERRLVNPLAAFVSAAKPPPAPAMPAPGAAASNAPKEDRQSKMVHLAAVASLVQNDPTKLPGIFVESATKASKPRKQVDPNAIAKKPPANVVQADLLCKRKWCDDNFRGTEGAFQTYWDGLPPDERQVWNLESTRIQQAKKAKKTPAATV